MRVLRTQIGLVMIWVAAPANKEAAKKSVGERWDFIWAWVSLFVSDCVGVACWDEEEGEEGDGEDEGEKEGEGGEGVLR